VFPIRDTIPNRHPPVVTRLLIFANIGVFIFQILLPEHQLQAFFHLFGVVPFVFTHPTTAALHGYHALGYWPFLTSMFLHGGFLHILSNMWTLWIFGDNVEDRMGSFRFLLFYLLCGVIAMVSHTLTNPGSTDPAIGASGAIAGVMGAYFLLFPHAMVVTLIPILIFPLFIPIPAVVYLLMWFLLQFFSGATSLFGPSEGGGIAWWAHIGGFLAGMWLYSSFLSPKRARERQDPFLA